MEKILKNNKKNLILLVELIKKDKLNDAFYIFKNFVFWSLFCFSFFCCFIYATYLHYFNPPENMNTALSMLFLGGFFVYYGFGLKDQINEMKLIFGKLKNSFFLLKYIPKFTLLKVFCFNKINFKLHVLISLTNKMTFNDINDIIATSNWKNSWFLIKIYTWYIVNNHLTFNSNELKIVIYLLKQNFLYIGAFEDDDITRFQRNIIKLEKNKRNLEIKNKLGAFE